MDTGNAIKICFYVALIHKQKSSHSECIFIESKTLWDRIIVKVDSQNTT